MTANATKPIKPADDEKATTVVANDPDDRKGKLKSIGGSSSDDWNRIVADQVVQALWLENSHEGTRQKQKYAALAALVGIGPKDEIEGMLVAQLIAAHNAAMEAYRRAMLNEQSFDGRAMNLAQANKLSRTHATLVEALNRHRGKGRQVVRVEHVTVNAGGQAIVGAVSHPGGGSPPKSEGQPHALGYAPGVAVPRTLEEDREAVQVAGGER